jgi:predicted TIM-barrel fold metal-dependent hydrolase
MVAAEMIDSDGHVIESGAELRKFGWDGATAGNDALTRMLALDERTMQGVIRAGTEPFTAESRLRDMDEEGIAVSINYPTALLQINQLPVDLADTLAAAYNSWTYETFSTTTDGRVLSMALVNIADPVAAVAEARRAVGDLGAPGIVVSPFAGHLHLDDPSLDPLWAFAVERDVAIAVHGGRFTTDPLLPSASFRDVKRYYVMAHPFGQMMALADFVMGGVFDRFPTLRVAFLEAGIGWVRWYADRLHEAEESAPTSSGLSREPHEYVHGGNCFFSCEPDEPGLQDNVRAIGDDVVVFASDYPHFDCSFPRTAAAMAEHLPDREILRKVTVDNGHRLYGHVLDHALSTRYATTDGGRTWRPSGTRRPSTRPCTVDRS